MEFDWMTAWRPADAGERAVRGRKAMAEGEVKARARLMHNLGWDRKRAARRIAANVRWEYEIAGKSPLSDARVKAIIEEVFG